jgi:ornithine cyclodeaminase/alanine dehydrogenase-like protein (mu-crystallin family)
MKDAIDAVRQAYVAFAEGRVAMPPVVHLCVEKYNGEIDVKTGYVEDFQLISTKIASGFYDNPKIGLPYPRKKAPEFIHGDELRSGSRFSHLSGLNAIA